MEEKVFITGVMQRQIAEAIGRLQKEGLSITPLATDQPGGWYITDDENLLQEIYYREQMGEQSFFIGSRK